MPLPIRFVRLLRHKLVGHFSRFGPFFALLGLVALTGCSSVQYPVNAPLASAGSAVPYTLQQPFRSPGDEELTIVLTFSGGGSRAAALAFGVVEELARHEIEWRGRRERLIDEVDLVYGVSGGSILAAYWSLRGDAVLTEFPERFLVRDIQKRLFDDFISVGNLWRVSSPRFGRGELLAERLDNSLFDGATFSQLATQRKGPFAVISAADLANGSRFDFLQEYFDLLCSDLGSFSVARAVAASSAVPLVFSPITLWNHGRNCPRLLPAAAFSQSDGPTTIGETRAQRRLNDLLRYLDAEQHPYVHLVDGGVADNLALRGMLERDGLKRAAGNTEPDPWLGRIRKALLITVDAGTDAVSPIEKSADVPRVGQVVEAMTDIPIQRYSDETRYLFQQTMVQWRNDANWKGDADPQHAPLHMVEVSLRSEHDAVLRQKLLAIPTTLYLPPAEVQQLRETGARMLRDSPEFQRLLGEIGVPEKTSETANAPATAAP